MRQNTRLLETDTLNFNMHIHEVCVISLVPSVIFLPGGEALVSNALLRAEVIMKLGREKKKTMQKWTTYIHWKWKARYKKEKKSNELHQFLDDSKDRD